ncbi:MAG: Rne/Rng family ribonuclease [Candidatus Nanopelagicales bacterium]
MPPRDGPDMVDSGIPEQGEQATADTADGPEPAAKTTAPPRRRSRRAATRPAGPPAEIPTDGADTPAAPAPAEEAAAIAEPESAQEPSGPAQATSAPADPEPDQPVQDQPSQDQPVQDQPEPDQPGEEEAAGEVTATTEEPAAQEPGTTDSPAGEDGPADPALEPQLFLPANAAFPVEPAAAEEAPAPKRSRRATRPVTTVAFSAIPEPVAFEPESIPSVERPVLALFQPPDIFAVPPRRHRAEQMVVEDQPLEPEGDEVDEVEGEDSEDGPRRRRRRGGRRRRRGGVEGEPESEEGNSEEPTDDDEEVVEAGSGQDSSEDGEGESGGSRRRRKRRRRAGVSEEMEDLSTDDPPNTVVKVRGTREAVNDDIASVRGSTRIEAKRQRRRDGREAGRRRPPILTEAEFLARREAVNRVMCVREHGDRTQIAVLEDGVLVEHYVNRVESSSLVGNVYLGKVQNVLPSMEAAFVDIGRGRNAVLYAGEVNWDAAGLEGQPKRIELALKSGDSVLVQVTKDPVGHKGARLTSQISLPGRFLVYVPEGSMTGISRKLPDTERSRLKAILKTVVPEGAGVIVRTAAEGATEEQLTADVKRLTAQWSDITKKAKSHSAPTLLYGEPDLAIKIVRDIFNEDFTELLVQGDRTWETLTEYIGWVAPDLAGKLQKWNEPADIYAAERIDEQIAKALDRKVWLPSGGSLVIDRTEAMTVVDVNTGKFTGQGGNLEETVTRNNLEAAEEIVRQLRLRDIGGIIVIDFIDMVMESNRDLVLRRLVECLGRDRTKHQVAEVTSLGLVQMTRKRLGQGLLEVFSEQCEACGGRGYIAHPEPVGGSPAASANSPVADEPTGRRRSGRSRVLGGRQTGKTPPPPHLDDQGHIAHDDPPGGEQGDSGHQEVGQVHLDPAEHSQEAGSEPGEPGDQER